VGKKKITGVAGLLGVVTSLAPKISAEFESLAIHFLHSLME